MGQIYSPIRLSKISLRRYFALVYLYNWHKRAIVGSRFEGMITDARADWARSPIFPFFFLILSTGQTVYIYSEMFTGSANGSLLRIRRRKKPQSWGSGVGQFGAPCLARLLRQHSQTGPLPERIKIKVGL